MIFTLSRTNIASYRLLIFLSCLHPFFLFDDNFRSLFLSISVSLLAKLFSLLYSQYYLYPLLISPLLFLFFLPFTTTRVLRSPFLNFNFSLSGSVPEEWTNQEGQQDAIRPLDEVLQITKLRHARTVR